MSYDSSNLTTPDIKWLGVRPSDLDRFNIPEQCRLPMTEEDMKTGKRLVRTQSARSSAWCRRSTGACAPELVGLLCVKNTGLLEGDACCLYITLVTCYSCISF